MKILKAQIEGFGKLKNLTLNFTDGINVIYGNNEAGKSTAHSFIKSIFFNLKNRKTKSNLSPLQKYEPWTDSQIYKGSLDFSYKNKTYTIERSFGLEQNIFIIYDNLMKQSVRNPELFLNTVLSNLTETSFDNTISVSQLKSATDMGLVHELKRYISNINTSGDISIDTISAIEYLKLQRKKFEESQIKDATINYTKLLGTIRNAEKEITSDQYKNKIPKLMTDKKNANDKIKANNQTIDELTEVITEKSSNLKNFGFETRQDIDTIKIETEKIFNEYIELQNTIKRATKIAGNILTLISGFALGILNSIFLMVAYPEISNDLNITEVIGTFEHYNFLLKLFPIPPFILIVLFYTISLVLFISGILNLIKNAQSSRTIDDMALVLSEIFNHQIGSNLVNSSTFMDFNEHIADMYDLVDDIEHSNEKINELKQENEKLIDMLETYSREIDEQKRLQYEVEQKVSKINSLKEDAEKLKKYITFNEDVQKEIDSVNLSIDTLTELSQKVKVMFGTYVNEAASQYLSGISNGLYNSLNVDNTLNVTINTNNRAVPIEQLSAGTMDQIYLSLRLAVAKIINGNNEILPLIFDDCFALYDNTRLKNTLLWLSKNYKGQIIIFTCHTREQEILDEEGIEFNSMTI